MVCQHFPLSFMNLNLVSEFYSTGVISFQIKLHRALLVIGLNTFLTKHCKSGKTF